MILRATAACLPRSKSFRSGVTTWRRVLLLPADVNRSLQDKAYADKAPHYAKQNFYAASLVEAPIQHQPQFEAFRTKNNLPLNVCDIWKSSSN